MTRKQMILKNFHFLQPYIAPGLACRFVDNVTLEYSAGGDVIILHVIDTPRNFTMKIFSPFITLEFFNKSSTGIAEGFYKLSLGKRTLYPGMYHSLLEFIYKVALFTMKDFGIPEPIGRLIFISTFIVITILFIYFLYKLRQKIGKKIRINPQLNYYQILFYLVLIFIFLGYCSLFFISSNKIYF